LSTTVSIRASEPAWPPVPGQPAWFPGSGDRRRCGGAHRKKKISAQLVEDEEYQLRHERVAGTGVAKGPAAVCTRLPPAREGGRRMSRTEEVTATVTAVMALAVRLLADGVELVSMESTSVIRGNQRTVCHGW
jgi:hypothetical protein